MTKRPTPETDARTYVPSLGASTVPAKFARKLERERDEAREKAERYRIEANAMMMQRDEAREKYDNLATEHMLAVNKLCNELDEARAISQQLIHIASHCLGRHDNTNPETITDAINRWNAATKK